MNRQRRVIRFQRRGQVLVITVLATVLLVGMIFFVMNVGDQINRRTAVQNAADSAAISGAVTMARSMNAVATNNVAMSRMLSLIPVMDSLPMNIQVSAEQVSARMDAINKQLALQATFPNDAMKQPMIDGLKNLGSLCNQEYAILEPMNQLLNTNFMKPGYPVMTAKTVYNEGGQMGSFWLAAKHLDEFNQATASVAGVAAQQSAARYAFASGADAGFVVPIVPELPVSRGTWNDWYRNGSSRNNVLWDGWIPDLGFAPKYKTPDGPETYTEDEILALEKHMGGFCKVLYDSMSRDELNRWRFPLRVRGGSNAVQTPGDNFSVNAGGGNGGGVNSVGSMWNYSGWGTGPIFGFSTRGPEYWMYERVKDFWWRQLPRSRVYVKVPNGTGWVYDVLKDAKLSYMFNPPGGGVEDKTFHYPQWHNDYEEAGNLYYHESKDAEQTVYFGILIVSPVAPTDPGFAADLKSNPKNNLANPSVTSFEDYSIDADGALRHKLWDHSNPDPKDPSWYNHTHKSVTVSVRANVKDDKGKTVEKVVILALSKQWVKVANYVWEVVFSQSDVRSALLDAEPTAVPLDPLPWIICRDIFGGADLGGEMPISNPANYASQSDLPAPMLLAQGMDQFNVDNPRRDQPGEPLREKFTYFGVAKRSAAATIWPNRFVTLSPSPGNRGPIMVGVAQAEIFNPTSWDAWTQDWHAQLIPVSGVTDWAQKMQSGAADQGRLSGYVASQDISDISQYLTGFNGLLDQVISH